jgi:hypothetical protein
LVGSWSVTRAPPSGERPIVSAPPAASAARRGDVEAEAGRPGPGRAAGENGLGVINAPAGIADVEVDRAQSRGDGQEVEEDDRGGGDDDGNSGDGGGDSGPG